MTKNLTKKEAHALLMQNKRHYLWNKDFKKWTDEDFENLINGKNPFNKEKPLGNKVFQQPIQMISPAGEIKEFKSIAEASRKTGINVSSIYAVANGRFSKTKNYSFTKIHLNN